MKTKSISEIPRGLIKPGTFAAAAMVSGFWASLSLALYFVSQSLMGVKSKVAGLLFLAIFAGFYLLHSFRPFSRLAALLGLCSLAAMAVTIIACFKYLEGPEQLPLPFVVAIILFPAAFGFGGILLDAEKYRRWLAKTHHKSLLTNYDYSI